MAALHPTESGCAFQEGTSPEGRPAPAAQTASTPSPALPKDFFHLLQPKRLRANMRRLRHVMQDLRRVECLFNAYMADQPMRNAENKGPRAPQPLRIPPLPPEGGEYRLYYVSPLHLEFEKQYLARHNVTSPEQLLEISENIISSYSGLIRNCGEGTHPLESTLLSMAEVLDMALQSVLSAHELYRLLEPVQIE